jgi:Tfp pilus assembly protein PilW
MDRNSFKRESESGFSTTELLVALVITGLVMTAVYSVFRIQFLSYSVQDNLSTVQSDVRSVGELLMSDIRNAGFGVPSGSNPVASAVNGSGSSPDSITLNLATSAATYMTSATVTGSTISVQSVIGFEVGKPINILDIRTKTVLFNGSITSLNAVANTITLSSVPAGAYMIGDVVVSPAWGTVAYALAGTQLTRTAGGTAVVLSNNIQDLQLSYIMNGGGVVTVPSDYSQVSGVQISLTGVTEKQVAKVKSGGVMVDRARQIQTVVSLQNRGF